MLFNLKLRSTFNCSTVSFYIQTCLKILHNFYYLLYKNKYFLDCGSYKKGKTVSNVEIMVITSIYFTYSS